jgi:hypothetical protein
MKRLFPFLLVAVMATSAVFAQGSWTAVTSFGLSTFQGRSADYLPSGVIWVAGGDVPYVGFNYVQVSTDHGATWTKRPVYTNATLVKSFARRTEA